MSGMETEEVVMARHSHESGVRKRGYLLNLNLKVRRVAGVGKWKGYVSKVVTSCITGFMHDVMRTTSTLLVLPSLT